MLENDNPEYSSAHEVSSAATADAFSNLFGDNYSSTVRTHHINKGFSDLQFRQFQVLSCVINHSFFAKLIFSSTIFLILKRTKMKSPCQHTI
jgi:hypothetical protein